MEVVAPPPVGDVAAGFSLPRVVDVAAEQNQYSMNTDKLLSQLVKRLEQAYGSDLRSVVLYGSAAGGDFHQKYSDLNVLCVLRDLGLESLQKAEQTAHWWRGLGNPAPLLWSEKELATASDAFPIEFLDIREQHRVLHGEELVAAITIDPAFHRVQVEHELRTKLLALRQRYLGIYRDQKMVIKLMVDALPSFVTLFRHALILAGQTALAGAAPPETAPTRKRQVLEAAGRRFGIDPAPFLAVLEVREGKRKLHSGEAASTFQGYYADVGRVCEQVDSLLKERANTQ